MNCMVCGYEFSGAGKCPVCGFQPIPSIGSVETETVKALREIAEQYKKNKMKDVRVYVRGYHWEEENGNMVRKLEIDIPVAEDIHTLNIDQPVWSDIVLARQTAGEQIEVTIIVENGERNIFDVTLHAPATEEMWNVGFALKPGFHGVIRVGAGTNYSESGEFSLKIS